MKEPPWQCRKRLNKREKLGLTIGWNIPYGRNACWRLSETWAFQSCEGPSNIAPVLIEVKPPTGEPDAREPQVRFGGRGDTNQCIVPTPIA